MPKLLLAEGVRAWQPFQRLMMALLRFLEPYLRSAHLTDAVRLLYKVGMPRPLSWQCGKAPLHCPLHLPGD